MSEVRKAHGDDSIVLGSEINHDLAPRCTSGSLSFDVALGGGWPMNQWAEIVGHEGSGKSALVGKAIAANQARDKDWWAFWADGEGCWDGSWMRALGVDLDRVVVFNDNGMEKVYEAAIKFLDSRAVDCVVIDSLPALVPETEDAATIEELQVGLGARVTNKFFRKQRPAMKRSLVEDERPVIGFLINQWREKIGVMYGDPRTTPGGKMKNFACAVRVEVKRDEWIEDKDKRIGQTMRLFTMKNKTAPGQRSANVDLYFDHGNGFEPGAFDVVKDMAATAVMTGVIVQGGGGIYRYEDQKWKGRASMAEAIRADDDLRQRLEVDVFGTLGISRPAVQRRHVVTRRK